MQIEKVEMEIQKILAQAVEGARTGAANLAEIKAEGRRRQEDSDRFHSANLAARLAEIDANGEIDANAEIERKKREVEWRRTRTE